jgi:glycerol dehydrogenase-like iron-containing ADH family enzyme
MKNFDFLTISPLRVIENINFFNENFIKEYNFIFKNNPILIIKKDVYKKFYEKISKTFNENSIIEFNEECSKKEISRITKLLINKKATSIIGMGGGKVIDASKVCANEINIPIITLPTSAATGACSSALSAIYNENGIIDECRDIIFTKAPDLVCLDYSLLIEEPVEFLIFGMTDSLAKYYESFAFCEGKSSNILTQTALNLAKFIKDTIFEIGEKSIEDLKNNIISEDLKNIFKINLILAPMVGGIGGEGCRVCVSHAVNNSLTQIEKMRSKKFMHGEQVAFGNLIQLYLDKRNNTDFELQELLELHKKFNLMLDFKYFKTKISNEDIEKFIKYIFSDVESLKNMPRKISKNEMLECLNFFKMI